MPGSATSRRGERDPEVDDHAEVDELARIAGRRRAGGDVGAGELTRADWSAAVAVLDRRQADADSRIRSTVRAAGPLDLIADEGLTGAAWDELPRDAAVPCWPLSSNTSSSPRLRRAAAVSDRAGVDPLAGLIRQYHIRDILLAPGVVPDGY